MLKGKTLLHIFNLYFRDLTSWVNDTRAVISQDELAKDVNGAEALLERHAEHKSEIDAREDSFRATAEAGQMLLDSGNYYFFNNLGGQFGGQFGGTMGGHAEHKSEIDAREDSFRATAEAGQMLLDSGNYYFLNNFGGQLGDNL